MNASSARTSGRAASVSSIPNSNFVSARMMPRSSACSGRIAVERERDLRDLAHQALVSDQLGGTLDVDRLVVPLDGLRRGREDRLGQLLGLAQPRGQRDARRPPARLVVASSPSRRDSRARRTRPAASRSARTASARPRTAVGTPSERRAVVRDDPRRLREPERRQAGQDAPLVGDLGRVDDVEGRDPVAGDEQQPALPSCHRGRRARGPCRWRSGAGRRLTVLT